VIHGGVFEGQVFATVAGLLARVPVIVTDENNCPAPPAARSTVTERVLRVLLNQNSAVVAVSPTVQRYLLERTGVKSDRVVMIPHGVHEVEVPPEDEVRAERARIGVPTGAFVVGTVCRLFDGHKRVSDLIAAVAQLHGRRTDVHLVVVGDGPDGPALEQMALALGIADRVHFLGYRNDHALFYGLMDVFALVSAYEAFGLVFAEAMSAGIPCIGSNVGGIPDVIAHGQCGLIVEKGDVGALASAIERLANEPQLRREMGDAARKRARDRFDVRRYAAEVAALYRKELEAARARGRC
jgi:glycosyltransferase involved in cell wall biosynthesis